MPGKRIRRLNEQFKREITGILRTEVRDPRVGIPTITGVDVTADLWMAKVYVRPGPTGEASEDLMEGLEAATPFIRRQLGELLTLRRVPELRFELDRTQERADRIESILREVLPPETRGAPAAPPEVSSPGNESRDGGEDPEPGTADEGGTSGAAPG